MDTGSKVVLWFLGILLIFSVAGAYYKFFILHDYLVEIQIDCDPEEESCFTWSCDGTVPGECTGDPDEDVWYYKYFYRNAQNLPSCDPADEDCDTYICADGEDVCGEVTCSEESLVLYDPVGSCTNPDIFQEQLDDSVEEEDPAIDADDGSVDEEEV